MRTTGHTSQLEPAQPAVATPCPTNQRIGLPLDTLTLKALLAVPLTVVSSDAGYRFCPAADCPTAYYRVDGRQVFAEADLRERVYQKHPEDPSSVICYCFGVTVGDVQDALANGAANAVIKRIQAGIQAGQCACDIRNPQGRCCLGNVRELMERLSHPPFGQEAQRV